MHSFNVNMSDSVFTGIGENTTGAVNVTLDLDGNAPTGDHAER